MLFKVIRIKLFLGQINMFFSKRLEFIIFGIVFRTRIGNFFMICFIFSELVGSESWVAVDEATSADEKYKKFLE